MKIAARAALPFVVLLLGACAQSGPRAPAPAPSLPLPGTGRPAVEPQRGAIASTCTLAQSTVQSEFVRRINAARASGRACGARSYAPAAPVAWNRTLAYLASQHSEDMRRMKAFGHGGSDGSGVTQRAQRLGYPYRVIAENVAYGSPPEASGIESAMADWLASAGHCANIMDPRHTEFGVACSESPATGQVFGIRYWTMVLGRPQ